LHQNWRKYVLYEIDHLGARLLDFVKWKDEVSESGKLAHQFAVIDQMGGTETAIPVPSSHRFEVNRNIWSATVLIILGIPGLG
jgi:hypothetical protein